MQFVKAMPFAEALEKIGGRTPIGSAMLSSEWSDVPVALRERAFFSSQVENVRFLQRSRDWIGDFLAGNMETLPDGQTALRVASRAQFVELAREFALSEGMGPLDPADAGTIKDITSEPRLGLIFNTVTQQADDYGYWRQGMDADVLNEFPAQRFIRVKAVKQERELHVPYEDQVYLKTDPIWAKVINHDFGVPWGPWGWGCGHDVQDEDRAMAEDLGLLKRGEQVEPDVKNFNENLRASAAGLDPDLIEKLKKDFGDQLVIEGEEMKWNSEPAGPPRPSPTPEQPSPNVPPPASTETLDDVLSRLGLNDKTQASAKDMIALRDELKETTPMTLDKVLKSLKGATETGALTQEKIRRDVQAFLDFLPWLKANALPKLQISVEPIDANGVYSGGGRVGLSPFLTDKDRTRVLFHELMHWVHREGPKEYRDAIRAHFEDRTEGERVVRLPGYIGVRGKKDDWYEAYAGRIYSFEGRPEGLEVPTRYIEWLTMDPEKMADLWNDGTFRETMTVVLKGLF
jgi:hypothetical protein